MCDRNEKTLPGLSEPAYAAERARARMDSARSLGGANTGCGEGSHPVTEACIGKQEQRVPLMVNELHKRREQLLYERRRLDDKLSIIETMLSAF